MFQAQDTIDSLIPLLFSTQGDLQSSIDSAMRLLQSLVESFELTCLHLKDKFPVNAEGGSELREYIETCRFSCTGNLTWR